MMTKSRVLRIKEWRTENIFLLIFCILGLLYTIAMPPFRMSDEYRHFIRAYEISQGKFISIQMSPANMNPEMAGNTTLQMWADNCKLTVGDDWVADGSIPSSYSPFTYFAATVVLFLVRMFTDNVLILVYAARTGQFATVALLLYPAIKYAPAGKNLFMFFSLLPMCMQEFAVLSGDAMVIALTIDVIVFVLYQRNRTSGNLSSREIAAMFLMAFFLGQCKCIYVFVCLLYFFIPKERFGGLVKKTVCAIAVGGVTGLTMLVWLIQAGSIGTPGSASTSVMPFSFPEIIVRTILANHRLYIASAIADSFGDLDIHPNMIWTYLLLVILLYVGFLEDKRELKLSWQLRLGMIGAAVLSLFALFYAFSSWTSPETGVTNGLQGRYFLPIYLLGILGIHFSFKKIKLPEIPHKVFLIGMFVIDLCVVSSIFNCCIR